MWFSSITDRRDCGHKQDMLSLTALPVLYKRTVTVWFEPQISDNSICISVLLHQSNK